MPGNLKLGQLSDDDFASLSEAMGNIGRSPTIYDDTPALSVTELRTKARRFTGG